MTYEESEDMSFQLSQVEILVEGFASKGDLKTLEEMMEKKTENIVGTF